MLFWKGSIMLTADQKRDMLHEIPLFAGCSSETLQGIANIAKEQDCGNGEVIYESGSEAVDMYVLLRGLVSFKTAHGTGHLHVETIMKRHMIFGWAALIPEHPRRLGTATCLEDCKLLVINGDLVMEHLAKDPQSGFLVMKRLSSMIASTFIEK